MRSILCITVLLFGAAAPGQSSPEVRTFSNPLGFSYSIPAGWEALNTSGNLAETRTQQSSQATSAAEKKGVACVQVPLTARYGNPASVIVEMALPFDCFGQTLTENQLPGFGAGATEGLKQSFDIVNPVEATYALGSHHLWIQRSKGSVKGQPGSPYTVEVVCGILKKAAVCWMVTAADDTALAAFEHGAVTLEDDPPAALVPATAFAK